MGAESTEKRREKREGGMANEGKSFRSLFVTSLSSPRPLCPAFLVDVIK